MKLFYGTLIAALLILFGVITKNSSEQMKTSDHNLGMLMFVTGWIYMAYILSVDRENKLLYVIPSFAILGSVIVMKQTMKSGNTPSLIFPIIFATAWIVLGYATGIHLQGQYKYVGLIASACVISSMMYLLPKQRTECVVDGPGMPLFTIAWAILILLNSNR